MDSCDRRVSDENALPSRLESVPGVLAAGNRVLLWPARGGWTAVFSLMRPSGSASSPYCCDIVDRTFRRKRRTTRVIGRPPGSSLMRNFLPIHWIQLAASGDRRRCYACKRNLFSLLKPEPTFPVRRYERFRCGVLPRHTGRRGTRHPVPAGFRRPDQGGHPSVRRTDGNGRSEQKARPCLVDAGAPVRHEAGAFPACGACRR